MSEREFFYHLGNSSDSDDFVAYVVNNRTIHVIDLVKKVRANRPEP